MVSKTHIDVLVSAARAGTPGHHSSGLRWYTDDETKPGGYESHELGYCDNERASEVGMMLWAENLASINYRYPDTEEDHESIPGPADFRPDHVISYAHKSVNLAGVDPAALLKVISCYDYQSCEHPGWRKSEAYAFCQALQAKLIDQLPGYNAAPWGIDNADDLRKLQAA